MFDRSLIRWQQDRPLRRVTVALLGAFAVLALAPAESNFSISPVHKFLGMGAVSALLGILGLVGMWRTMRGTGYFVLAMMLLTWPLIFLMSQMTDQPIRGVLLAFALLDLLFTASMPPGLLMHLFWGMWQQLRQARNE